MYFKLFKPQDWRKDPPKHVDAIVWCCLKEFRRAETCYDTFLVFCNGRRDLRRFRYFAYLIAVFRHTLSFVL